MTDEQSPDSDSRRARLATRRRRIRVLSALIALVLIAGGIATAAAITDHDNTSGITPGRRAAAINRPDPDSTVATAPHAGPPRAISHDDPMRLWIGGDSLSGSFGPALGQTAGATGVVKATIDYKVSSGLADNGIRNWYQHAQQAMSDKNPDAVVFIIGANDVSIVNSQDSNDDGVHDWQVDYRAKIDRMMETFVGGDRHRTVYWLGPPTMGDHSLNRGAYELGRVMKSEAAKFAPDVAYVDTYNLFADANGDYSRSLPNADGEIQTMRISDGIHFSVHGAEYLADVIWKLLDKRWDISAQVDPSNPIDYTIAPGSNDFVPGVGQYRPTVPSRSSNTTATSSVATTTAAASTTTVPVTRPASTTTKPVATTTKPTGPPTTKPKSTTTKP